MLRKLPVDSLQPGMYLTSVVQGDDLDCPILFSADVILRTAEDIDMIRGNGYTEAFVDLTRSDERWRLLYGGSDEEVLSRLLAVPPKYSALRPQRTLHEELPQAKQLYAHTLNTAQQVMQTFKNSGKMDIETASSAVENIMESVSHNANALLAISKLRTKDNYTFSHCVNVATEAVIFATHLGYEENALHTIGLAGFFHDFGKIGIPQHILNAPRRLTAEEFAIMRTHTTLGYGYLKQSSNLSDMVIKGALEHHERVNGTGYPDGKRGDEISIAGRILAIVDIYDALSSRRVYKAPIAPHQALGLIYGMRGEEFVPELVDRFIQCIGIYPPGSLVKLNNDHLAVISQVDPETPLKPQVVLVRKPGRRAIPLSLLDLKQHPTLHITQCLDPRTYKLNPLTVLEQHAAHE